MRPGESWSWNLEMHGSAERPETGLKRHREHLTWTIADVEVSDQEGLGGNKALCECLV